MRTYNPGKLTKCCLLVHVVTESTSGYIGYLEFYSGEGKKLQETILSILEPYLDQNYHVYQDNYYNSVAIAEHLLSRKVHVYGTIRILQIVFALLLLHSVVCPLSCHTSRSSGYFLAKAKPLHCQGFLCGNLGDDSYGFAHGIRVDMSIELTLC
ncbi:hypothetical protein B7P43_G11729 [Cryptotermes secundus]|uniref:PiggyBac transposable element-derived protein domain-containing protein n=1 Tax=Cryptotermes secundus TaxID=105785 RepID=A0A2J7PX05_9NEOP|nr:hypothetical protein B7P43_G11729 [Cryptotermes secundus]